MKVTTTVFLHSFLVLLLNSTREGTSIIQIRSAYSAIRICMYHFLPSWFKMGRTTFLFTAADFPLCKIDPKKKMFSHLLKKSLRLWIKHLWQEYNPRFAAVKSRLGLSFSSLTFAFPFLHRGFLPLICIRVTFGGEPRSEVWPSLYPVAAALLQQSES